MSAQAPTNSAARPTGQADPALYDIAQASATDCIGQFYRNQSPAPISLPNILHRFTAGYRLARERYRQRKQLMEMDDRQLKDIGITPEQAELEAGKPIWRP